MPYHRDTSDSSRKEALIQALFTQSQDAIMTLAPPQWSFTSCNPAAVRFFGVSSEEEFVRLGPWNLSPEIQPDGQPSGEKAKQMIGFAMEKGSHLFSWEHCRLDGTRMSCTVLLSKVSFGESLFLQATVRDVSDYVQLSKQNQFIMDTLGIGAWTYSRSEDRVHMDGQTVRLLGLSSLSPDAVGLSQWEESLKSVQLEEVAHQTRKVLSTSQDFSSNLLREHPQRGVPCLALRMKAVRDAQGEVEQIYGMVWDCATEMARERAIEAERAKSAHISKLASLGEMSASVAHEINNPLAVIRGVLSLLDKYRLDEEKFRAKVETLEKSAIRMEKIVKGLRKFSRTSQGSERKHESVEDLLKELEPLVEPKAKSNQVRLFWEVERNLLIYCDAMEIHQVLVNLIHNAVDAIKDSQEKWVRVVAKKEGEQVIIQVMDSGRSLTPEIEEKIFDPFFTTKPIGEGTGLGLSISKTILEQHGARIFVNRQFPTTCFEIRFSEVGEVSNVA